MQYNQFSAKMILGIKQCGLKIRPIVGPDLDPYYLQRSFKINMFLEIVKKIFILFQNF